MKTVKGCVRCNIGKGFYSPNGCWMFIGKDGSFAVRTEDGFIDFPIGTIQYCPWCGKELHPTEKGGEKE